MSELAVPGLKEDLGNRFAFSHSVARPTKWPRCPTEQPRRGLGESLHFRDIGQRSRRYPYYERADHHLQRATCGDRPLRESWGGGVEVWTVYMYRVLAIAVLLAATVFPLGLEGQLRAIQRPSGPVRISVGSRISAVQPSQRGFGMLSPRPFVRRTSFVGPVVFRHHLGLHIFFGNTCFSDLFFDPFFCRQFFFRNRFLFAQPVFLPYAVYTAPPYYHVAEQTPATVADRESDLSREVDRLRDEVERLREEQVSREEARQAALQPRPRVEDKTATTILVFRDGRRSEVQNYAIVGQTLWVFSEQRARKILVSDLDLAATKKANAERGVEFLLPGLR